MMDFTEQLVGACLQCGKEVWIRSNAVFPNPTALFVCSIKGGNLGLSDV